MFYSAILPAENIIDTLKQHPQLSWEALRLHSSCILLGGGGGGGQRRFFKGAKCFNIPHITQNFLTPALTRPKEKMANHPTPTSLDKESTKQKNKASKKADENLQIKIEWPDQLSMKRKGNCKSAYCWRKVHTLDIRWNTNLSKRGDGSLNSLFLILRPSYQLEHCITKRKKKWLA